MMLQLTETRRVQLIAALSATDPRTVRRHLRGEPLRQSTKERIEAAVVALGQLTASMHP
jgi:hypothetical protein